MSETPSSDAQYQPPPIAKGPLRPAPTQAYNFKHYNPHIRTLYARHHIQVNSVLANLPQSGSFGFDLEWRPNFTKGALENRVSLIQLANHETIMLFQVSEMTEFPTKLKELLANPTVVKAGVGIQGDAKKLYKDHGVSICNCVDLSLLARTADNDRWAGHYNSPIGLARLIENYEHKLLIKGKISRSNWEANLTPRQQEYASNDAHAGYTLYKKLEAMLSNMTSPANTAWYSFNVVTGLLCNEDGSQWEANNPNYDPGPLPPPKPPTEAQLQRRKRREEKLAKNAAEAASTPPLVEESTSSVIHVQPLVERLVPEPPPTVPSSVDSQMSAVRKPTFDDQTISVQSRIHDDKSHHSAPHPPSNRRRRHRSSAPERRHQPNSTSSAGQVGSSSGIPLQPTLDVHQPRSFPNSSMRSSRRDNINSDRAMLRAKHSRRTQHLGAQANNRSLTNNQASGSVPHRLHIASS